ncbi:MAG TPA: PKD domain-containing protein, partial [Sphingomonas sp.]|nr:PKD domain-containing protein [Sphingomonas sp.]
GDWYRRRVEANLGAATDANFRIWYTDHALHGDSARQEDPTRTVSYLGVLQQALRDLSLWVEKGITPPASTAYSIADGQVIAPANAAARKGIQPVVTVTANGHARAAVKPGQTVRFVATIAVPPGTGSIVAAAWDFDGVGTFPVKATTPAAPKATMTLTTSHAFARPGTYYPVLRVASERHGNIRSPYARIQNLGRVRVVVK